MGTSLKLLVKGVAAHWGQAISGALMALVALVAAIRSWTVPPRVWLALSIMLFLWAIVRAFHDLRQQCDAAMDGLADKIDHEKLSEELTEQHALAVHKFVNSGPFNTTERSFEILEWYDEVVAILKNHRCSVGDFNHVNTIAKTEIDAAGGRTEYAMLHIRLNRIADVATKHAKVAEELALEARKRRPS